MANEDLQITVFPDLEPGESGVWWVRWRVENRGNAPLTLDESWFPHGRFRGERVLHDGTLLAPGASRELRAPVQWKEAPGVVVENAFLICRFREGPTHWRQFVRLTVTADAVGAPHLAVELVTTEPIAADY